MNSFNRFLREVYPPELPYGFAERATYAILQGQGTVWDVLLTLTPRAGVAIGALATILIVLGFAGSAPGLFEAVEQYSDISSLITLP